MIYGTRIFGLLALFLLVSGCSALGALGLGGGDGEGPAAGQAGGTGMVQEIMDLEAALRSERQRADKAEGDARRANEEAAWLAGAAEGAPETLARVSELEGQLGVRDGEKVDLVAENERLEGVVAQLRDELAAQKLAESEKMAEDMAATMPDTMQDTVTDITTESMTENTADAASPDGPLDTPEDIVGDRPDDMATPMSGGSTDLDDTGIFGLHVASYRSKEELVRGWKYMRAAHAEVLGPLGAISVLFDVPTLGGTYYRLVAGPVTGQRSAGALCDKLSARGEYCVVSEFDGDGESLE